MMRKIIYSLLALSLFSCADFIDEESKSNVAASTFYLTPEGYQSLIAANYSQLREIYGNDAYVFCAGTDLYAVGLGRGNEPDGLSRYLQLNPSSDGGIQELYESCYQAIQKANTALYYSELTEQTSDIPTLVGEVKYLRANAYFLLVQSFGGVGIVDEFIQTPTLNFDRNSAEEVYAKIILDLEESLDLVSEGGYAGKVNKRAVRHLLAKVYLTRAYESFGQSSDFATAASYAEDAIAGQSLAIPFADLWEPGNEMNAETIFSVRFSSASISTDPTNLGHKQANWFGPYLGGPELSGKVPWRSYTLLATDFALELFTEEDERYEATFMTEVFSRYYAAYDGNNGVGVPVGQKSHYYVPQWATQADIDAYVLANPTTQIHLWGTYAAGVVSSDYQTIPVRKFDDPSSLYGSDKRVGTRDIILSRLGETYLIAAEAYLNTNPTLGLQMLNAVRTRAGITTPLTSYDIDTILDERARELFGEYHRWFDLKRTGKLVERASAHNYRIEASYFDGNNGELKILRPIPQSAIDLNQNNDFPQNPAYQ
jgi:hypothetical protein